MAEVIGRFYMVFLMLSVVYFVLANDIHGHRRKLLQKLTPLAVTVVMFTFLL